LRIGEGMVFREKSRRVFKYCAIILWTGTIIREKILCLIPEGPALCCVSWLFITMTNTWNN
jgi:hypothetical protein